MQHRAAVHHTLSRHAQGAKTGGLTRLPAHTHLCWVSADERMAASMESRMERSPWPREGLSATVACAKTLAGRAASVEASPDAARSTGGRE